jgi:glycine oxidase
MLSPGGEVASDGEFARLCLESHRLYPDFVGELAAEAGGAIDFVRCGAIEYAATESAWAALVARARAQAALGIRGEPAPERQLSSADDGKWTGAMFYPGDAIVDPRDVMACLRVACERRGVRLKEGCAIREVEAGMGGVRAIHDDGAIAAEAVVIAAGAWSGLVRIRPAPLDPALAQAGALPGSIPARGHLIAYDLDPGQLGPIRRHRQTYLLQRSSGELVAGTSEERVGFERGVDPAIAADIAGRAARLLPLLAGREPARRWTGFRPALAGSGGHAGEAPEPLIGRWGGSALWLAYGHYRNGILLAPATAAQLAAEIAASLGTR